MWEEHSLHRCRPFQLAHVPTGHPLPPSLDPPKTVDFRAEIGLKGRPSVQMNQPYKWNTEIGDALTSPMPPVPTGPCSDWAPPSSEP